MEKKIFLAVTVELCDIISSIAFCCRLLHAFAGGGVYFSANISEWSGAVLLKSTVNISAHGRCYALVPSLKMFSKVGDALGVPLGPDSAGCCLWCHNGVGIYPDSCHGYTFIMSQGSLGMENKTKSALSTVMRDNDLFTFCRESSRHSFTHVVGNKMRALGSENH